MDHSSLAALATKAGIVWVRRPPHRDAPVWFSWHDEAIHLVVGGAEQPDPFGEFPVQVQVIVPGKDNGAAVATVAMLAQLIPPGTAAWLAAVAVLKSERLNARADLQEIWATDSRVVRLVPVADPVPAALDDSSAAIAVDISVVRPRGWRPMRAHLRRR